MSDQHSEQNSSPWSWITLILILVVIYPLSLGPALVVVDTIGNNHLYRAFGCVYFPLFILYEAAGEPEWVANYVEWWYP